MSKSKSTSSEPGIPSKGAVDDFNTSDGQLIASRSRKRKQTVLQIKKYL